MNTAVILGAGFSKAGGLPLTRDLFISGTKIRSQSAAAARNHQEVEAVFADWQLRTGSTNAEQFLSELYTHRTNLCQAMIQGTTWSKALRYALSRLVELPPGSNSHYYFGITTPRAHPVHRDFWKRLLDQYHTRVIVTLNYDLLIEQALHSDGSVGRSGPRCYYGGFMFTQSVKKMLDVTTRKYELVQLGNEIALYKLHGSLNWAWEHHSPTLKIHDDVRAVFRHDDSVGTPAIIPPILEKEMPGEFVNIWQEAATALRRCERWIVCGYSMPAYDVAVATFFASILRSANVCEIVLISPESPELAPKWEGLSRGMKVIPVPGLPEALDTNWTTLL